MERPTETTKTPDFELVASALDGMCVGLVLTNAVGRVTWANRSARTMLGFELDDGQGRLLAQLLRDLNMAQFWHEATQRGDVVMGEVDLHWPVPRQLKVNATRCVDGEGQMVGRALLFCDVTQEHHLQVRLSAEMAQRLLDLAEAQPAEPGGAPHGGLTQQELRILRLVAQGLGNKEIGREIHVAATTVRTHLKHLYGKLGLTSRNEAISYALRHGLK